MQVPRDADHLLVRGEQMAQLEQQLFASGLPVEALMEKAALGISQHLLSHHNLTAGALVLVGPGHNGGDGLVVARELHLAGLQVRIWSPFERHKPLTASHLAHARWLGIPVLDQAPDPTDPALWIDGLLGIGQRQAPTEAIQQLLLNRQRDRPWQLVAIDVPTGLCADRGIPLAHGVATAHTTLTLGLVKTGLVQDSALAHVGSLVRIDLGLPARLLDALPAQQPLGLTARDRAATATTSGTANGTSAATGKPITGNPAASKYQRGRLLVVAGSDRYRGAAALALAGASSSGCGSLRAALPAPMGQGLWQQMPHVVVSQELPCKASGDLDLTALAPEHLERLDTLLVGPGIGSSPDPAADPSWRQLQTFEGLLVLDADGLNRLARLAETATGWLQQRQGPTWITPHRGEFDRLFPTWAKLDPLDAARQAAQTTGASVVLKGARSVVSSPDGRCWQLMEANPQAARAGLGDVLAGYAAGRGAMDGGDGAILAAAALDHAVAGCQSPHPTPQMVASQLALDRNG